FAMLPLPARCSLFPYTTLFRSPTLVMDSNALPGFTNRRLAMFVDRAALTFDEAMPFFGKKGVVTGNPVRAEFFDIKPRPEKAPRSEEHTSELQSRENLVCRLLL